MIIILLINVLYYPVFAQTDRNLIKNSTGTEIKNLIIKGNVTVFLLQGNEQTLFVQGKKGAIKQLTAYNKGQSLYITKKYGINDERVNVYLTLPDIEVIKTSGEVRIETPTNIWLNKLKVDLSDETEVILYVNSNDLKLAVSGAGSLYISGYIDTLRISGTEESEINGKIKSINLSCRISDYSTLALEGVAFKSYLSAFHQGIIDLGNCESGISSIVAFDRSMIKAKSIDLTDIYAFDKAVVNYKSTTDANILELSKKATIKRELLKTIARN